MHQVVWFSSHGWAIVSPLGKIVARKIADRLTAESIALSMDTAKVTTAGIDVGGRLAALADAFRL